MSNLIPYGAFLNHAEGGTLLQAVADGISGGRGKIVITEDPCGFCRSGLSSLKSILRLDELEVIFKSKFDGNIESYLV